MLQLVENGMPTKYLDEEGLSHVVDLAKKKFADKKELWNWQKTEKAGAVAFTPVSDSVLEPVVEFKFKETLPAEGEKGPENPSSIQGVQEVNIKHIGANLAYSANNYRLSSLGNGFYRGTVDNTTGSSSLNARITYLNNVDLSFIDITKNYCCVVEYQDCDAISVGSTVDNPLLCGKDGTVTIEGTGIQKIDLKVRDTTTPTCLLRVAKDIVPGTSKTFNIRVAVFQCTAAEIDLDAYQYEKQYNNYTVNLNGTYYGGYVDVANGTATITHQTIIVTPELLNNNYNNTPVDDNNGNFQKSIAIVDLGKANVFGYVDENGYGADDYACNLLSWNRHGGNLAYHFSEVNLWISIAAETAEEANTKITTLITNAYNAGTPLTAVYPLAEPYTIQLDSIQVKSLASLDKYKPRINTIYTDAESVQVGYQKFTAEGSFVHTTGNETIDGEKTFEGFIERDGIKSNRVSGLILRNKNFVKGEIPNQSLQHLIAFCDSNNPEYSTNTSGCHGRAAVIQTSINSTDNGISLQNVVYKNSDEPYENYYNSVRTSVGFDANGIPYATAPETSDERTNSSDIVTRDWAYSKMWNLQKTKKEQYVQFYPASDSNLEPIVDFTFIETPPTEGEKSIDNPSTITGVNEIKITRCGKSVRNIDIIGGERYGITCIDNGDGSYTVNGIADHDVGFGIPNMITLYPGTYTLSGCPSGGSVSTYFLAGLSGRYDTGNGKTFVVNETQDFSVWIQILSGTDISTPITFRPQLELGSAVTSFEPYEGNDYTVQLGNTYYGGSINLATGVLTATHYAYAFTGAETGWWERTEMTNVVRYGIYGESWSSVVRATKNHHTPICSHFTLNYDYYADQPHFYVGDTGNQYYFYPDPTLSRDDWKAWLAEQYAAGHPLTVCFELAEPVTIQLTPIQIKSLTSTDKYIPQINTIYTDASSVQVGYQRFVDDENIVHKTGEETITGLKTITSSIRSEQHAVGAIIRNNDFTKGTNPSSDIYWGIPLCDVSSQEWDTEQAKNHGRAGLLECRAFPNGDTSTYIVAYRNDLTSGKSSRISVSYDFQNDIAYATAPETSNERNNSSDIVTRGWRISEDEIDELSIS